MFLQCNQNVPFSKVVVKYGSIFSWAHRDFLLARLNFPDSVLNKYVFVFGSFQISESHSSLKQFLCKEIHFLKEDKTVFGQLCGNNWVWSGCFPNWLASFQSQC